MTSSNGSIFRVTGPLCGEFPDTGEFPSQRPLTRSFDVFCDLRLNKRLSKRSWGWWFGKPSRTLWRRYNELRVGQQMLKSYPGGWLFVSGFNFRTELQIAFHHRSSSAQVIDFRPVPTFAEASWPTRHNHIQTNTSIMSTALIPHHKPACSPEVWQRIRQYILTWLVIHPEYKWKYKCTHIWQINYMNKFI